MFNFTDYELVNSNFVKDRKEQAVWYVLHYDTKTSEYKNDIVFKTFAEAKAEFDKAEPYDDNDRVELMFAPEENDAEYYNNEVMQYKKKKGFKYNGKFIELGAKVKIVSLYTIFLKDLKSMSKDLANIIINDKKNYEGKIGIIESVDDNNQAFGSWGGIAILESDLIEVLA